MLFSGRCKHGIAATRESARHFDIESKFRKSRTIEKTVPENGRSGTTLVRFLAGRSL
jgi:hypothetical protein